MGGEIERWHLGGRYYGVTVVATVDSTDLELDDLGPGVGRGCIAIATIADGTDEILVSVVTDDALPIDVLEQFTAEARRLLPPT